ncbi:hypothetical protein HETIRDRAFT_478431 [Heterobasidion irregulare TC 32-1]|uniref:Uncharacterized protein n=1 Tax=Heterobasidion irregulare (strain TC 32-1) TaxID=747525 RepID=W4K158_HETIT|nr:uncharacterized protein HETIRDRAFT_478431 [Heterobasidion irregulare TC 32-1]ETW79075.1 hypothetical protein HETIRDRAFT_478431 [Heterobasidion irregulare TC 32-1]
MPFFAIFLSTASHISSFARPTGNVSSSRFVYIESENPRAPVNETPFDIAPNFDVGSRDLGVRDVSQVSFMANFGRPLWWAMLHGSSRFDELGALGFDLLDLARRKLIGDRDPNETALPNTIAALAVVDVRLCLDHDSCRAQTRDVLDEMTRKHMRILYSMPQHREYYQSGYPSEPILAEAAAMQLDHWRNQTNRTVLIDTLLSFVQNTHLNVGDRAEVVGRALLTEAYDRAIIAEHPALSEARFSQGCLLTSFIRELLTEEAALAVLESQPDNVPDGATFGNAFKDARVRFTHFTKLDDEESLITAMLFVAFIRGMAFVASSDEAFIDVVIPVSLRDEKLGESVMTGILIQFKRWGHARTAAKVEIDAERLGFFPSTHESHPRPYCALIMQLKVHPPKGVIPGGQEKGVLGEQRAEPSTPRENAPGLVSKVKRRLESLRSTERDATHPRYHFSVYGCSNTVYKGILEEENRKYAALLSSGNTFHDHGRQTEEQLAEVWRMKPSWSAAMGSYHWVEGADIISNVLDEGDGVVISQYPGYEGENSG